MIIFHLKKWQQCLCALLKCLLEKKNVFLVLFRVLICEYEIQREVNIETISATTYVNSVYILAASKYHVCGQADGVESAAFYTSMGAGLRARGWMRGGLASQGGGWALSGT